MPSGSSRVVFATVLVLAVAATSRPQADAERRPAEAATAAPSLVGTVTDSRGAPLAGASITLLTAQGTPVASRRSDAAGSFRLVGLPQGSFLLRAEAPGFAPRRLALRFASLPITLTVALLPESFREEVTVTAVPGSARSLDETAQSVSVIGEERIALRAQSVLAQAASEQEGLALQRTSPSIAGVYVRGLTGAKVNVYVDGVRYTTAAQRGGINTFLDLVDPEALEGIEVVRGPSSAEYGSDALGGSVQLLTRAPSFSSEEGRLSGSAFLSAGTADASGGAALTAAYAAPRFGLSATLAGRRVNRLRPGLGVDSHSAVTRYLGLPSDAVIEDERLPDTAFTQYGGQLRASLALSATAHLSAGYLRGQQDGGRRYDQLLGGDGNLVADLRNLMSDHAWLRFEKLAGPLLDRVTLAYSFSAQREERVNQGGNGNPAASVNHEPERDVVHGLQAGAQRRIAGNELTLGGDLYLEQVSAPSFGVKKGVVSPRRGRVPDGARYRHGGVFLQDVFQATRRLKLEGGLRWAAASYRVSAATSPAVDGQPLWPDDSYGTSATTFRLGAVLEVVRQLSLTANVARGFRAPDVTDLGSFGLTGSGYEVSNREVQGLGATVGTTADAAALSTGEPVRVLEPETSLGYELGLRWRSPRLRVELTGFVIDIEGNISKQALILPAQAEGTRLGDEEVVRQLDSGVVYVGAATSPVLVRSNFDAARLRGLEAAFDATLAPWLSASGVATAIRAEERASGAPPDIEGGTPAPEAWLRLRLAPSGGRRFWIEPYLHGALRQTRLSTLDLEDRRTGAMRSRAGIASFFANGARARGWVGPGADGISGSADDVLLATGETLPEVQDRVLGAGVEAAPLLRELPGYLVFGVRGALRFGARHELLFDLANLGDANYRGVSWGVDAPGRGLYLRYVGRF